MPPTDVQPKLDGADSSSDEKVEQARSAASTAADRFLRVADGMIIVMPCAVLAVTVLLLLQPRDSWIVGTAFLLSASLFGALGGVFLGWRFGNYFVGGTWWKRRQRDALLAATGVSFILGIGAIVFHQIRIPPSQRMNTRVARILDQASRKAGTTTNVLEKAKLAAVQELSLSAKENLEQASRQLEEAKRTGNEAYRKNAEKVLEENKKLLRDLAGVAKNPDKDLPQTNAPSELMTFSLPETSVTNRNSYKELRRSPALMFRLLGVMGGLFGFSWMSDGREVLTEHIERTTRGTPPNAQEIRDLMNKLQSTEPTDQEAFLDQFKHAVERINTANPNKIKEKDMTQFRQDIETVRAEVKNGEGDRIVKEAFAAFEKSVAGQDTSPDRFKKAHDAVIYALELDAEGNRRFSTTGQKERLRLLLAKKRSADWQSFWEHQPFGLKNIEVR